MDSTGPDRSSTRFVELRQPRQPHRDWSRATVLLPPAEAPPAAYFRLGFTLNYDAMRLVCSRHSSPGIALVIVDERGVVASAWLGAKVGQINSAILGRHQKSDVWLPEDETLSLRHLALLTYPLRAGQDVRFRLLDLRTPTAFTDERGLRLGSLEAEGPAFVACGRYGLFFLPTGDDTPWPTDPASGWQCIPERVYLDEATAEPDRWQRPRHYPPPAVAAPSPRVTLIRTSLRPRAARRHLVDAGDQPLGELHLQSPWAQESLVLGSCSAAAGVLLGRYERCDNDGLRALSHERISRVHCLLIEVDGTLYLVDAASTNGTFAESPCGVVGPDRVRILPLESDVAFNLGLCQLRLRWRSLH